ncbi:oligosaccharide flippase family protein [Candidatus Parcubacteria bacterium]|nr:oligosaccharide flippase family protein [Candidatus Parcubacteria bacterium]
MKFKEGFLKILNWLSNYTKTDIFYVARGSFWWICGRVFSFLASFLTLIAFSKFATKEVYGAYQYIISMAAMIGILTLPGIDVALVNAIAKGKERTFFLCEKEKLKFGFWGFLVFLAISIWYFLHKAFELGVAFLIAGTFYPFLALFQLYFPFWQGKKKFDLQNKYFIFHNFLGASILIAFIYFKPKMPWVVFGYFFGFSFATFIFWFLTRKKIKKETEEEKETIPFGKHITIMALPGSISAQIDNAILWQVAGPVAVAIYAYALRLIERVSELIPFSALALPKMAERDLNQDSTKKRIFDKFLKLFWFSIPFTLLYILICPFFFKIFFPAYSQSVIYSQVLAITLIFSPFSFLATAFFAQMKKRELYILNFGSQILKIILFFILIPLFQIWGGVLSILISQVFSAILTVYFFKKL